MDLTQPGGIASEERLFRSRKEIAAGTHPPCGIVPKSIHFGVSQSQWAPI